MAGRGKKKRTDADEAENSIRAGQEQPLEEEKTEKKFKGNQKDQEYRRRETFVFNIYETFCEQPKIIYKFKTFLEILKKSFEENPEFTLKVDKAICGVSKITKNLEAKYKKKIEKSSKKDGTDELWKLLDSNTYPCLCGLLNGIRCLAEIGTPSEPPNAAAGSSGSPHSEEKLLELVKEFCEELGITENFKVFCEKKVEEQGKFCEELGMASDALWEDGANQHSNKEIQMILKNFAKNPLATLEENLESEMIQTVGIEDVTAMNSGSLGAGPSNVDSNAEGEWQSSTTTLMTGGVTNSSSARGHGGRGRISGSPSERAELKRRRGEEEELHEALWGKRPATADTSPCPSICDSRRSGFMADARRQSSSESATAHLFSTNKGIETGAAVHDKVVSSHAEVEKLRKFTDEPGMGSNNFAKLLLGSSISHAIYLTQQYEKLQVKDAERRKQEQEVLAAASIDANPKFKEMKKERDDLKKQAEKLQEEVSKLQAELAKRDEPSGTTPPGDPNVVSLAANSPPLQTANTGANNADQEDNIANRENKAAEADNQDWVLSLLWDSDIAD